MKRFAYLFIYLMPVLLACTDAAYKKDEVKKQSPVGYVDTFASGQNTVSNTTITKPAAAPVVYITSAQVDAKIAAAIAAYKKTVDLKFAAQEGTNAKLTTATGTVANMQVTVTNQGKTLTSLGQKVTAQAVSIDTSLNRTTALQNLTTGHAIRLDRYNTRLYQREYDDSTQNIDIYYLRGKVGDLTSLFNSRDSLVGRPGQIQISRLPTGVVMFSLEPEILLQMLAPVGKLND